MSKQTSTQPDATMPASGLPPRPPSITTTGRRTSISREGLRRDLERRRSCLTPIENSFLEDLIVNGNEIEVSLARDRLNDEDVFFDEEAKPEPPPRTLTAPGPAGRATSVDSGLIEKLRDLTQDRPSLSRSQSTMQSEQGLKHLTTRRSSQIHQQMWKAHESGIAVSKTASRKSVTRRNSSALRASINREVLRYLSSSTLDLLTDGGPKNLETNDKIFRGSGTSAASGGARSHFRASFQKFTVPPEPELIRLKSDSSRKSVTFKDLGEPEGKRISPQVPRRVFGDSRAISVESTLTEAESIAILDHSGKPLSPPAIQAASPLQSSESLASFASIRRAEPLRAESRTSSLASFGSLERNDAIGELSKGQLLQHPGQQKLPKPVLFRKASRSADQGEGIEVSQLDGHEGSTEIYLDSLSKSRAYSSLMTQSFDDTGDRDRIFRGLVKANLSDEEMAAFFLGSSSKCPLAYNLHSSGHSTACKRGIGERISTLPETTRGRDLLGFGQRDRSL